MVISDENRSNLVRPTTMQGGLNVGTGKLGQQQVRHTRRALGVINESLVAAQGYPCVVNKRAFPEKREFYEKKQADPAHRPITRKFAAQIESTQLHCPKETKLPKLPNTSAINPTGFGDCIFIDEECESPEDQADQPEPMFLEQAETVPDEADDTKEIEMEDIVEEPIVDIDGCDLKNPLAVVEYVEDLYAYYRRMEGFSCVPPNYLEQQFDINEKMRAILIDWLIEVHDKFELQKKTLFLTVNLIDRFLSKQTVVRKKLQLVGLVAMLLACKYEEVSVPVVGDLIFISDKAYTRKEVLEMENLMLNTLQFNMSVSTPYVFMKRFLKAAQSDKKLELRSFFLMELSLVEYEMLKFPPSLLAAAAVYTAQATLYGFKQAAQATLWWSRTCEWHTSYSEDQLLECSSLMVGFHQKASTRRLTGAHRKYCTSKLKFGSSDDRVGSTQIEQNQRELDPYPAICCQFESKLVDGGSSPIVQTILPSLLRTEETARPIFEEYKRIRSNLSDDFDCRMLEHNPYEWQFGIRGASGTEFEGGIYHGRIQFPEEYPSKPPSFTLLTENGRFKTHTKIRIRRLNDWQPSWRVRHDLDALIDEMPTYPDGELGSVEYNKKERRDLAIKSRAAPPKYGTSERQKLSAEIHEYLLSKSPPVPVPQLIPSQVPNGTGGRFVVNGGYVISGNTFHANNSKAVGILDSMNAYSNEDHKLLPSWLKLLSIPKRWRKQN